MINVLETVPTVPPSLYIDLEGDNLSRYGSISILQLYVSPYNRTYISDVYILRG